MGKPERYRMILNLHVPNAKKGLGIIQDRFHSRYEVYKVHLPRSSLKIVGKSSSVNLRRSKTEINETSFDRSRVDQQKPGTELCTYGVCCSLLN